MTRLMFDSVAEIVPADAKLIMAYINGVNTAGNYAAMVRKYPGAKVLTISTNGDIFVTADIYDCEKGDYTVQSVIEAARIQLSHRRRPTIYCDRSDLVTIRGTLGGSVDYGVSTLDGEQTVPDMTNVVFVQFEDTGEYDISIVYDDAWHPTQAAPVPTPLPGGKMGLYITAPTTPGDPSYLFIDGYKVRLPDTATVAEWESKGAQVIPADHAFTLNLA